MRRAHPAWTIRPAPGNRHANGTHLGPCLSGGAERRERERARRQCFPPAPRFVRECFLQLMSLVVDPLGIHPLGKRRQRHHRRFAKRPRTQLILRIGPQRRANHRPTSRQRTPRPPDVQRRNMPMPNRLLPPRVRRNAGDGQVHFDQAFRVLVGHPRSGLFLPKWSVLKMTRFVSVHTVKCCVCESLYLRTSIANNLSKSTSGFL
jgi:hypothetical protein